MISHKRRAGGVAEQIVASLLLIEAEMLMEGYIKEVAEVMIGRAKEATFL